jgi:ATP-dependent helicase HrpA
VLPLFARLSQQSRTASSSRTGRRIVLATNVAETSLTVPGIRYVIDAGHGAVKRYSFRSKVEQLQIEPISQAAANQRAGRCGRVADGICIRLYDEKADFRAAALHRSGDPALVAGRRHPAHEVAAPGLVEDFPFIEPPPRRAIADGYQLLNELGAVDDANELTPMGASWRKLPLDPRVGRMILEAREREALARCW